VPPSDSVPAQTLTLAALIIIGAMLRLAGLSEDGLWLDEAFTANVAALEFPALLHRLADDNSAPLHYLLVRAFTLLLGASEWSVRLPSALCAILSIALIFDVTRVFFNARAGLAAALLLTILPYHVHYAREGRAYALLMLLLLGTLRCLAAWHLRPSLGWGLAGGLCALAALYTHNVAPFFVLSMVFAAVLWMPQDQRRVAWLSLGAAGAVVVLGYLPWLPSVLAQRGHTAETYAWLRPAWEAQFPMQPLMSLAAVTSGSLHPVRNGFDGIHSSAWAALIICCVLVTLAFRRSAAPWLVMTVLPLLLVFGYSAAATPVYVVGRMEALSLVTFTVLVGASLERVSRMVGAGALLTLAALSVQPLQGLMLLDFRSSERTLTQNFVRSFAPHDALVVAGPLAESMRFYLGAARPDVHIFVYPPHRGHRAFEPDWSALPAGELESSAALVASQALEQITAHGGAQVWVMRSPGAVNGQVLDALSQRMQQRGEMNVGYQDINMHVFTPGSGPP